MLRERTGTWFVVPAVMGDKGAKEDAHYKRYSNVELVAHYYWAVVPAPWHLNDAPRHTVPIRIVASLEGGHYLSHLLLSYRHQQRIGHATFRVHTYIQHVALCLQRYTRSRRITSIGVFSESYQDNHESHVKGRVRCRH